MYLARWDDMYLTTSSSMLLSCMCGRARGERPRGISVIFSFGVAGTFSSAPALAEAADASGISEIRVRAKRKERGGREAAHSLADGLGSWEARRRDAARQFRFSFFCLRN